MSLDFTDDKSTLAQVMAWCRQATSHYLSQCWPHLCRHMASLGHNELTQWPPGDLNQSHFEAYFNDWWLRHVELPSDQCQWKALYFVNEYLFGACSILEPYCSLAGIILNHVHYDTGWYFYCIIYKANKSIQLGYLVLFVGLVCLISGVFFRNEILFICEFSWNINQTLNIQKKPHISHLLVSYEVVVFSEYFR